MTYRVIVKKVGSYREDQNLYTQEVEEINLLNVIAAVNDADFVPVNIYPLETEEDNG